MTLAMTADEIARRIADIEAKRDDAETAHSLEDDLYRDFIAIIATDERVPEFLRVWAQMILGTKDIEFPRWCA